MGIARLKAVLATASFQVTMGHLELPRIMPVRAKTAKEWMEEQRVSRGGCLRMDLSR